MDEPVASSKRSDNAKGVSRRKILQLLATSGAMVTSYLIAPAAWAQPRIGGAEEKKAVSAIITALLSDEGFEIATSQENAAECHDYCIPPGAGDSARLLPLGVLAAAGPLGGDVPNRPEDTPCVWCSANYATSFKSPYRLNLSSVWDPNTLEEMTKGPWDFTWYRGQDDLYQAEYGLQWQPLGLYPGTGLNISQEYRDGSYRGVIERSGSSIQNSTRYDTQLRHRVYNPPTQNFSYHYSNISSLNICYL